MGDMRVTSSLATRLSELLQPIQAGFFMSYFHRPTVNAPEVRPGWKGEGDVVHNALADLVASSMTPVDENEIKAKILLLHDIVLSSDTNDFPTLDAEQQSRLTLDVQLCIAAT